MQTKQDMFRDIEILMSEFNYNLPNAINYVAKKNSINAFQLALWRGDYQETGLISK